jgi:glyoxylase-like metal-dependent hydrolase (beta-lactamase superfamily II)
VTNDGIILMDPLNRKAAAWFKAEAKKQFNKEVRNLINSHGHCDHAEGGELFDKATVIAQENIVDEYKAENVPARYPDVTYRDHMTLRLGGEAVELYHFGNDHGKALSYLYHPATKILVTVDVMARERLPYRELPYDDPQATIDTFNELEKLDVDLIIPGHGNIATKADIARERAYWQLLRAAVTAHIVNGRTLDEIKQLVPQQMAAYSGWQMFKEWGPFNIEGMHRILLKQGVKVAN